MGARRKQKPSGKKPNWILHLSPTTSSNNAGNELERSHPFAHSTHTLDKDLGKLRDVAGAEAAVGLGAAHTHKQR